jgi:hypothetical protein
MSFLVLQTTLVAASAGTDVTVVLGAVPSGFAQGSYVPRASLISPALLTGATATHIVFTFRNRRAGTVIGTFATVTTDTGTDLAAGVEVVGTAGAVTSVQAGDVLELVLTHAGAGTAYGAIVAQVALQ